MTSAYINLMTLYIYIHNPNWTSTGKVIPVPPMMFSIVPS